jgi:hypothetical protein
MVEASEEETEADTKDTGAQEEPAGDRRVILAVNFSGEKFTAGNVPNENIFAKYFVFRVP